MTTISYAQNFEDVMLLRALGGVERGFYVDVGAQDPVLDSVTKAFYERNWRGINLEPVDHWFQKLVADRPEDINLRLAAWSGSGRVRLFEVAGTGMSTVDPEFARRCVDRGLEVEEREIDARPLDAVCAELGVREVHFLKVDVEGAEAEVFRGMTLEMIRPWIILVEATEPNSQVSAHEQWEHLLTDRGYHFTYFDGLNRFYVAAEHLGLKSAFSTPPNYFDHYVRYPEWRAQQQASRFEGELETTRREMKRAEGERAAALREAEVLRLELATTQRQLKRAEGEREAAIRETAELREIWRLDSTVLWTALEAAQREAEAERQRWAGESGAANLRIHLRELLKSRSLRFTAALRSADRWLRSTARDLHEGMGHVVGLPRRLLRKAALQASRQPRIRGALRQLLKHQPGLRLRIKRFVMLTPGYPGLGGHSRAVGPPGVARMAAPSHPLPARAGGADDAPDGSRRFSVAGSIQSIVDVEEVRERIRRARRLV